MGDCNGVLFSMASDRDIWIIVPAFNEAAALATTLTPLCHHYTNVVLVDDGSTDDTVRIATRYPVFRLQHLLNRGQGAALRTGIEFAIHRGAEILVTFDADGQHSVGDIDKLIQPILHNAVDVTLGSRFLGSAEGLPHGRRIVLRLGVLFTRFFSKINVTDTHNGMRAFSKAAAIRLKIRHDGMAHASEILDKIHRLKLRFQEVPVGIRYSWDSLKKGQSNWNSIRIVTQLLLGRLFR